MHGHWEKFVNHPELGPLIKEYNYHTNKLRHLKQDLRSADNIEALFATSRSQLQAYKKISRHLDVEALPAKPSIFQKLVLITIVFLTLLVLVQLGLSSGWIIF